VNRWEHRYVWDAVRAAIVDATGDQVSCPHRTWRYDQEPPACHDCMESGLGRLIADGARDDEILAAASVYPIPERRWIEETLTRLRNANVMTDYARGMIPKIARIYRDVTRNTKRPASKRKVVDLAGVDRDTIADWIARGWMRWPPD
jgi:hypothetical protein